MNFWADDVLADALSLLGEDFVGEDLTPEQRDAFSRVASDRGFHECLFAAEAWGDREAYKSAARARARALRHAVEGAAP